MKFAAARTAAAVAYYVIWYVTVLAAHVCLSVRLYSAYPLHLGLLDGGDLLCHHGQNLHVNAVKLIETGPGPRAVEETRGGTATANKESQDAAHADSFRLLLKARSYTPMSQNITNPVFCCIVWILLVD